MQQTNYELWIEGAMYSFDTIKEAYLYYLEHFATKEDFEYYKQCAKRDLKDNADNPQLIVLMFENVFNEKHHLYRVVKRVDGKTIRT
jgi:hypothetical protein